jgi:hypothetical protein
MARAVGPERRTMPIPPRPGGVEMATMVSSKVRPDLELESLTWIFPC